MITTEKKPFHELWVPNGMKLAFDPNKVAESTRIMTDDQYYLLKQIAGGDNRQFDAMAVDYLSNAEEAAAARQAELASQQLAMIADVVRDVLAGGAAE